MGNQTWLAEVLFAGLTEAEREHVIDVMGEVTDAELRRLRAHGADKSLEASAGAAASLGHSQPETGVDGIGQ
jgi:hypothetical protein